MSCRFAIFAAVIFSVTALADDQADRLRLSGKWQAESDIWSLDNKGDAIHLTHSNGSQTIEEFECNTLGSECAVKDSGKGAKVSLWYSGPKLVVLETKGSEVVKRRFSAPQSDMLDLEVIRVVPEGKTEMLHLKRVQK